VDNVVVAASSVPAHRMLMERGEDSNNIAAVYDAFHLLLVEELAVDKYSLADSR